MSQMLPPELEVVVLLLLEALGKPLVVETVFPSRDAKGPGTKTQANFVPD